MVAATKREGATVINPFGLHRELPRDDDAESYLLSCCMLDGGHGTVTKCMLQKVGVEQFYDPKRQTVMGAILDLYSQNKPTDISMVADLLRSQRKLEDTGGIPYLVEISQKIPTSATADHWIARVKEQATLRLAIREMTAGVEDSYNFTGDLDQFLANLESRIDRVSSQSTGDSEETVQEVAEALLQELNLPKSQRNGVSGEVGWGVSDLDHICGKMGPGTLNILAGRPSTGKSALADMAAWQAAKKGDGDVIIFSYEMRSVDKVVRIAQQESRLNLDQFDDAPMDRKVQFTSAIRAVKACKSLHIYERDTTLNRVVARTRAVARRGPVKLIVVDFLQYLARLEPTLGKERTDEKIGRLTAGLKSLAKDHNCPVLLLSSLNREGVSEGKPPTLASLRNSGEIESDADVVMMLHWPTSNPKTGQDQDPHDQMQRDFYVECLQEKGRSRGVHSVGVTFDRPATRFTNWQR
jgi:replicative DNA helicase